MLFETQNNNLSLSVASTSTFSGPDFDGLSCTKRLRCNGGKLSRSAGLIPELLERLNRLQTKTSKNRISDEFHSQ